jgi:hypothetical protein
MNGRPLGLREAEGLDKREEVGAPRPVDDDVRKAWAAALSASIPADPLVRPSFAAGEAESTAGWRRTDVSMTDLNDELTRAGGRPVRTASQPSLAIANRLETVVNTAGLGRVSFVVDRSNAGLSIVVEVASDAAGAAVDAERLTLLRTLRAAGLTVLSFRVLVRGNSGTALADRGEGQDAKGVAPRTRYRRASLQEEEDDDSEIDVVG